MERISASFSAWCGVVLILLTASPLSGAERGRHCECHLTTWAISPVSDVGPNQGSPVPGGEHWTNVSESVQDGDNTYLLMSNAGDREVFVAGVSLPVDIEIASVILTSTAEKNSVGNSSYRVGFIIGGVSYFGATHTPSATEYTEASDVFLLNPATGVVWIQSALSPSFQMVYEQVTASVATRFTQLIGAVVGVEQPARRSATAASLSPRAATVADLNTLNATPTSIGLKATPTSLGLSAIPSAIPMRGTEE